MTELELYLVDLSEITALTAEIVGFYVGHHTVASSLRTTVRTSS